MDNLTHSLAGAILGQMGLKKLTGRAMPTLIIAANLPDLDAVAALLGTQSLAIRRGITHGPPAMLILPLLLTAAMLAWERWRPNKSGQPVRFRPLLLLACLGTWSHPALDWLNSYGVRLLEPFSHRWFAGDTLFIIDVWIWATLIVSVLWSRRSEKRRGNWRRPAWIGFTAIGAYILGNGLITGQAEAHTHAVLQQGGREAELVVANPLPVTFWNRRMLWRDAQAHGSGDYGLLTGVLLPATVEPNRLDDPALAAARGRKDVEAFLFWSRMPMVVEENGQVVLKDQRFSSTLRQAAGRTVGEYDPFTVVLSPEPTGRQVAPAPWPNRNSSGFARISALPTSPPLPPRRSAVPCWRSMFSTTTRPASGRPAARSAGGCITASSG
jgi:inner membrane protein